MAIEERRITQAVRRAYNCNYPCESFNDCIFGCGCNTAYDCEECGADEYRRGYLGGAKEQRQIDIEKACEVYRQELSEIKKLLNMIGKDLYNANELGEVIHLEGCVKDFRNAMEKI